MSTQTIHNSACLELRVRGENVDGTDEIVMIWFAKERTPLKRHSFALWLRLAYRKHHLHAMQKARINQKRWDCLNVRGRFIISPIFLEHELHITHITFLRRNKITFNKINHGRTNGQTRTSSKPMRKFNAIFCSAALLCTTKKIWLVFGCMGRTSTYFSTKTPQS